MPRSDLIGRGALAVAALVAALVDAPRPVVGALVGLALLAGVERLARARDRGPADAVLVTVGGAVVAVVLLGLVLGTTPIGLSPTTWGVGTALVAGGCLGVAALLPRPAHAPRSVWLGGLRALPWAAAVVAVVAVAVTVSVRSVGPAEQPPLQMSFGKVTGNQVEVRVSAAERTGPLELRTTRGSDEISYPLFTVRPGATYTTTVALPLDGRYVVSLNRPDQSQPLRSLTLDR